MYFFEYGCTDELFIEFNPDANTDDGSCLELIIIGCMDSAYMEYDPNANYGIQSELCNELISLGCMNPLYVEYDLNANVDDDSCEILKFMDVLILHILSMIHLQTLMIIHVKLK